MDDQRISGLIWLGITMTLLPTITVIRGWKGISINRQLPRERIFAGEDVKILVNLENFFYVPFFWVRFSDKLPISYIYKQKQENQVHGNVHFLTQKGKNHSYTLYDVPRGNLSWNYFSLFRTDLFGFVEVSKDVDCRSQLLIYPRYVDVSSSHLYNQYDENNGVSKLYKGNDYSQISGVREYQRGDKLSLIHWKVSARKNNLMSKEFYPLLNQETHIVLDCHKSNYPDEYNDNFELAVSVAASLVNSLGKVHKGIALLFNNKNKDAVIFKSKEYFINDAMKRLALVQPSGDMPLERFISQNYLNQNSGVSLLIVTNKLSDSLIRRMLLGSRNIKYTVYYVGEDLNSNNKYSFIKPIKELDDLKNPKVRSVANG
ncbi:DUF58 domain-containing protein [Alkalicella caledoniensis]|uniref:DUF58 domain-containing protein n=1 Tax=Alkalicella caledoniensis TaxID=2731377 RepID=A0A7G9W964_ALKCA|nr:DUF58 domain-containing protein [Alkalicella caledoniensis]QNO15226.1 DUF58 domain-containing protein [Alkalicella caledoniensis]